MKKIFNFLGDKINEYEEDWDELDDSDFGDEYYSDEYDAEPDESDGQYYESESDEQYYEGEADGQYYEGEADEQYYEGEADEQYYEDEYYVDDSMVDDTYYEDDAYCEDEAYCEDDSYYADEWEDSEGLNIFAKIKYMFANMDMVDRVVTCTGVAVLILALITGTVFAGNRLVAKQVNSFDTVGTQLDGITVIGGEGLMAVADAQIARQEAAVAIDEEEDDEGYSEEEYTNEVTVALNMTSIKKDLKIKFVNKKTGKLIANIPFAVDVKAPDGKTYTWTDDDKDGIIYKTEIAHGEYTVAMLALEGYDDYKISTAAKPVNVKEKLDYEKVDVSDEIKTEAEVDAAREDTAKNEVEQESSLQDTVAWVESTKTAIGETYVEVAKSTINEPKVARFDNFVKLAGTNGETVSISGGSQMAATGTLTLNASTSGFQGDVTYSWSVSGTGASIEGPSTGSSIILKANNTANTPQTVTVSVTATSTFYDEVSGNTPTTYSGTASVTITIDAKPVDVSLSLDKSNAAIAVNDTLSLALTVTGDAGNITWSSDKTDVASVQGTDTGATVKGLKAGTATITASGGGKSVSCTVTVTDTAVTIKLDKTAGTVAVNGTMELNAVITGAASGGSISWSTDKADVATVTGDKTKATVKGVKAGDAIITATYTQGTVTVTATCKVKVTDTAVTLKLDKTEETILAGNTLVIVPTITGNLTDTAKITWSSDKTKVATVTGDKTKATVKGVKAGEAIITATYTEGSTTVTATCKVKVQANPALDTTTALKDKNGNQIYIKNTEGKYAAATYADYFKANQKFYLKQQGYKYTGWQTIDGGVYYFDANGNKVTGAQVIQGAQYSFDSNGKMVSSNGILGIDVSKWNGSIDWNAVKNSGVSYVIIRCGYRGSSQGSLVEDPKYRTNIQGATSAGLKVGVYFFTQAINEIEAVEEASMVLSLVKGYKISYPIFLDVESGGGRADGISKATRTEVCKAFCQTIKNSGYTAGVYANKTWFNSYIDAGQLGAYRIWLAQYAAKPTYSGRYDIWQYSSQGKVGGISGNVDMNLSYMGY